MSWPMAMVVGVWMVCVGVGMGKLAVYSFTPGHEQDVISHWPFDSALNRHRELPTLLFFAHPKCPCTRASMDELAKVMTLCRGRLHAVVIFVIPAGAGEDASWTDTDLWESAKAIPGVVVRRDLGGREAIRFGAATSGATMLYGRRGELCFHGGITVSRGHCGDNPGRSRIVDLVQGQAFGKDVSQPCDFPTEFDRGRSVNSTPVFGCPLLASQSVRPPSGNPQP